jgi:hypothetical protein
MLESCVRNTYSNKLQVEVFTHYFEKLRDLYGLPVLSR